MLLTIDIGNTNVTLGVFDGDSIQADWRLRSSRHASKDEVGMYLVGLFQHAGLTAQDLDGVCLASVVPPLTGTYVQACKQYLKTTPLVVETGVKTGVKVMVSEPRSVGADRIVNACAVKEKVGGPAIVVDFGTATTFDALDKDGNYLGGAIAPGLEIAADSPLALNVPVGFRPSSLMNKLFIPRFFPNALASNSGVAPSPRVTIFSSLNTGSSSAKRHMFSGRSAKTSLLTSRRSLGRSYLANRTLPQQGLTLISSA